MTTQSKPLSPRGKAILADDLGTSAHLIEALRRRVLSGEVLTRRQVRLALEGCCEPLDQALVSVEFDRD